MTFMTTLYDIAEHKPCQSGWKKLLQYLGKKTSDSEPLGLLTILESNGVEDALWCLGAVRDKPAEIRNLATWMVRKASEEVGALPAEFEEKLQDVESWGANWTSTAEALLPVGTDRDMQHLCAAVNHAALLRADDAVWYVYIQIKDYILESDMVAKLEEMFGWEPLPAPEET